jgi:hypothetical protein
MTKDGKFLDQLSDQQHLKDYYRVKVMYRIASHKRDRVFLLFMSGNIDIRILLNFLILKFCDKTFVLVHNPSCYKRETEKKTRIVVLNPNKLSLFREKGQ